MELTAQSPRCRSDERAHVNTRLSHRKHAFASPHHRRRSRGDNLELGHFENTSSGGYKPRVGHARCPAQSAVGNRIVDAVTSFSFCFLIPVHSYRTHSQYTYISRSMNHQRLDHQNQKLYMKKTSCSDVYSKHPDFSMPASPTMSGGKCANFFFLPFFLRPYSVNDIFPPAFVYSSIVRMIRAPSSS